MEILATNITNWDPNQSGISLIDGWLPILIYLIAAVALVVGIGWRTKKWLLTVIPLSVLGGLAAAYFVRWKLMNQGTMDNAAPDSVWFWVAATAASLVLFVFGFTTLSWARRAVSGLSVLLCLLSTLVATNSWVGYYRTVEIVWNAITAGPLPDQIDASNLAALRGKKLVHGVVVEANSPDQLSHFSHRNEYVYLPPAWFVGKTPPKLPVILMIGGEFNTPQDWIRSGNAIATIDYYARLHHGVAPILGFVDVSGSFNNDTECVNGPRGNVADHINKEYRPFLVNRFKASNQAKAWGIVGWSMGGTCAISLAIIHPELYSIFVNILGDAQPNSGNKQQTLQHLYNGNIQLMNDFNPFYVLRNRNLYYPHSTGWIVAGQTNPKQRALIAAHHHNHPQNSATTSSNDNTGLGGRDTDELPAHLTSDNEKLCNQARKHNINCTLDEQEDAHTWQIASEHFQQALPWLAQKLGIPGSPRHKD